MLIFLGLLGIVAVAALVLFLLQRKILVKWYEWLLGGMAVVLLFLGVQHYYGSQNEFEPTAGAYGLAIFGGLAILIAAFDFQLIWRRNRKTSQSI